MVLPNLGRSITIERLIADYTTAQEKGEEEERRWASQHLNVEIGLALHADRWRGADYWLGAADPSLDARRAARALRGGDGRHRRRRPRRPVRPGGARALTKRRATGCSGRMPGRSTDVLDAAQGHRRDGCSDFDERRRPDDLCSTPTQDVEEVADIVERIATPGCCRRKHGIGLDPPGVAALVDELGSPRHLDGRAGRRRRAGLPAVAGDLGHGAQAEGRHALAWRARR